MPTYEYVCTSCGRHFDVQQSFSDPALETCEVCGGKLKRVFHPVGVVLKGSGFYATDNRAGKKSTPPKESDSKPSESKPAETKSDSLPKDAPAKKSDA